MKISVNILGYDNYKRVIATIDRFYNETNIRGLDITMNVFIVEYPLPDSLVNFTVISKKCIWNNIDYYVIPNKGQDGNLHQMADKLAGYGYDIFVPYDTDVAPRDPMWLQDAVKIFKAAPDVAVVSMNCKITDDSLSKQQDADPIAGIPVKNLIWHGGFPICIFRHSFLESKYTQYHSYYGGTEYAILEQLRKLNLRGVMMCNHDDARNLIDQDPEYNLWKHYAISKADAVSFAEWLTTREK